MVLNNDGSNNDSWIKNCSNKVGLNSDSWINDSSNYDDSNNEKIIVKNNKLSVQKCSQNNQK